MSTRRRRAFPFFRANTDVLLLLALLAIGLIRLSTLGAYPLLDSTEGRYAEIPRIMFTSGDWVTPQEEPGVPFWAKPPLSFWLTAATYSILGVSEFTARLPSFLLAALSVWLIYLIAADLRGRRFGLRCALILSSMGLFNVLAGGVMTDPSLSAAVTLSMAGFILALRSQNSRKKACWGYLFFLGFGMSVLAKGLVAWVLVLMPITVWTFPAGRRREVAHSLPWLGGALLVLAVVVPWHILAEARTPGFLHYYFVGEHFKRFLVAGWKGDLFGNPHEQPRGMICIFFLVASFPWIVFLGAALAKLRGKVSLRMLFQRDPWLSFLLLWGFTPVPLFALCANVMMPYVLPALPAFSIVTAYLLEEAVLVTGKNRSSWFLRPVWTGVSAALVPVAFAVLAWTALPLRGIDHSEKALVKAFLFLDRDSDAELIYADGLPHSADFYSQGRARGIPRKRPELLFAELRDMDQDYFIIEEEHLDEIPREMVASLERIAQFGEHIMFREPDPFDSTMRM